MPAFREQDNPMGLMSLMASAQRIAFVMPTTDWHAAVREISNTLDRISDGVYRVMLGNESMLTNTSAHMVVYSADETIIQYLIQNQILYFDNYVPRDIADAEFTRLWERLDWERRSDAPRREYWQNNYGLPYTYGRGAGERTYECKPWDMFALAQMERLNAQFGYRLDCCFMNGYADKRDALGWHADDSPEMDPKEPVISFSLGGERDIEVRENATGVKNRFRMGHGSVFIMPPGFQQTHEHRIPKAGYEVPPRISLTYRGMLV